ncbi:MAG: nucleotide exchange factor GrpE, partial [Bdellovibrionales bacterium]|nr:nucleotide exchange factor GrpE [Bdellovibrionales bacterium]
MSSRDEQNEEVENINDESVNTEESSASENSVEDQLTKLKSEYLYLRAEFDNYRKNTIKERSQLIRYGAEPLLRELLTVLDNFDLALGTKIDSENIVSFKQGMEMTAKEFRSVLTKFGLKEEDPTGEPFDPNKHEALSSEPTSKVESGHIVSVFKKAYLLHDKLIRPAQVTVAREPDSSNTDEDIT